MPVFVDSEVDFIAPGEPSYYIYLFLIIAVFVLVFKGRGYIGAHAEKIMRITLIAALVQQLLLNLWYLAFSDYTIQNSLPLQICRVVVWMIILQYFIRKEWLYQTIFYWSLFAYAAFVYPMGIRPIYHITGISFFLLHGLNVIYPFIAHFATGFLPTLKGAFQAWGGFVIYIVAMYYFNEATGANYFYTHNRPFFDEMGDVMYMAVNIGGTLAGFLIVYCVIKLMKKYMDVYLYG